MGHGHSEPRAPNFGRIPPAPKYATGSPQQLAEFRKRTAELIRELRATYTGEKSSWTHREWNKISRDHGRSFLKTMCAYTGIRSSEPCRPTKK